MPSEQNDKLLTMTDPTDQSRHDASDSRGDLEQMSDSLRVEEFVLYHQSGLSTIDGEESHWDFTLGDHDSSVFTSNSHSRDTSTGNCFKGIFYRGSVDVLGSDSANIASLPT